VKTPIYPGWWQVAVAMVIQAVSAASIFTAYSLVVAPLKVEFEPSNMFLMLGITAVSLVSGLLSPPIGAAIDRISVRWLMLSGSGLIALGFLLLSISTAMIQVIIIYGVFMSVGSVLLGPIAASALLARWFSRRRGLALGLASSGAAIGGLLLPPLLQALIDGFEWRMSLRIYSCIIFLLTGPMIILLVRDRPSDWGPQVESERESAASLRQQAPAQKLSTASILRDSNFWLISLMLGTVFCGAMGVVSNLIQFVSDKGISASEGAVLLSIFSGANFAGKLLCAGIIDRVNLRLAMAVMLGVLGAGMFGFLQAEGYGVLVISSIICGVSGGAAVPIWGVILARVYGPDQIGKMMGAMSFVIMPFTLLSPPIFGWVFDQSGSYDNAFIGYLVLLAFAMMLLAQLHIDQPEPVDTHTLSESRI
jgi:sugar phosphate permease